LYSTTNEANAQSKIQEYISARAPLDFVIFDDQTEGGAERLALTFESVAYKDTNVIHLYTPTISRTGQPVFPINKYPSIFKLTKPPRKSRMLQVLAELKNLPSKLSSSHVSALQKVSEDISSAQRSLYGNVLIAEGTWPEVFTPSFYSSEELTRQSDRSESLGQAT
jgi:hypothetical protein